MTMVSRRTLLKGFGGAVGAAALPAALVGCGGDDDAAPTIRGQRRGEGGRDRHDRLQRLRPGAEGVLREGLRRVQDQDRRRREGQHGRPQHLPGADQLLSPGPPGRRLHVVRRLPHAVLRPARPGDRHLRRLGQDRRQLLRGAQERVDRPRRQAVLRAVLLLPVGALLPQERLRGERLRGPGDARRPQGAGDEDEERRPVADRLRRQGRLARDGDLRHPQPAHQRLRLPHAAHEGRGELAGPEGGQGLRHLARAAAVPPAGRARPHLAGGRKGTL